MSNDIDDYGVLESARDAVVLARLARQCADHVKGDGPEDREVTALAAAALADAERLRVSSSRLAAALKKAFAARRKSAA